MHEQHPPLPHTGSPSIEFEVLGKRFTVDPRILETMREAMRSAAKEWGKTKGYIVFPIPVKWGDTNGDAFGYTETGSGLIEFPEPHLMVSYNIVWQRLDTSPFGEYIAHSRLPEEIIREAVELSREKASEICGKYGIKCEDLDKIYAGEVWLTALYDIERDTLAVGILIRPRVAHPKGIISSEPVSTHIHLKALDNKRKYNKVIDELFDLWYVKLVGKLGEKNN